MPKPKPKSVAAGAVPVAVRRFTRQENALVDTFCAGISAAGGDWQAVALQAGQSPEAIKERFRRRNQSHLLSKRSTAPIPKATPSLTITADSAPPKSAALAAADGLADIGRRIKGGFNKALLHDAEFLGRQADEENEKAAADSEYQRAPILLPIADKALQVGKLAAMLHPEHFAAAQPGNVTNNFQHHRTLIMRLDSQPEEPPADAIIEIDPQRSAV